MQKDEIIEVIRDYVHNKKANYAVLINGAWGSGKTYFYEHELTWEISKIEYGKNHRKAIVYISLYGLSSIEQLSKELLMNYFVEAKLQGDKYKKSIYRQISRLISISSKTFSLSAEKISVNLDKCVEELKNSIKLKDMIICLDDFERCAIPINELFGMINNLVEHCNCKVIILADENNIGKMYANTNVEAKYLTLLTGKSLKVKQEGKPPQNDNSTNEITIEELKKYNEEIYSENYIYKDIKEKVIGLTLNYTPNLKDEYESILSDTVNSSEFTEKLIRKKEKVLECMDTCGNSNIRIMKTWLIFFERIYKVIKKYFADKEYNRYFDTIFDRFAIYSIRVACAIGNNKPLNDWGKDIEIGYIKLQDDVLMERQGYRFVDDLFIESVLEEQRVCHAAKVIISELQEEESYSREASKRQAYNKLSQWYYLEDKELFENLQYLITEIANDEYKPQDYQNIIAVLIILKQKALVKEEYIKDVTSVLKNKLMDMKDKIVVENFGQNLPDQGSLDLFHQLYDPLYSLMEQKNRELDKQETDRMLDYSSGNKFLHYCIENADKFLLKKTFIKYIDLNKLVSVIKSGDLRGIYDIIRGFGKIYGFGNLHEIYDDDADMLKDLIERLENLDYEGKTRKYAIDSLCDTLKKKVSMIENREQ